mmetsp:Transcript_24868/g.59069  ORF Transcript_24868/g.59069 Transcript_24868/m.59069 type:complete len:386 (+) Transcript_24868:35-1192(+)
MTVDQSAPIYLDYNATTPLDPKVQAAMLPYVQGRFGNPSSGHWYGVKEKEAVNKARADVAALVGADPEEIIFTSGGTESVNWAIKSTAERLMASKGRHMITSEVEHVVVLECAKYLEEVHGFEITRVPVDRTGRVEPEAVESAIRGDTVLVSIMHANNETGSLNDIAAIAKICNAKGVLFHTDASQSVGKVDIDLKAVSADLLTIAGHKLYAPAGVGALFVRKGTVLPRWMHGAGHEGGRRAGTENVMHLVALGTACAVCKEGGSALQEHLKAMRELLHKHLSEAIPDITLNGHPEERLPNTLNISLPTWAPTSHVVLAAVGGQVAASAGSACHADQLHISHVLKAMGVDKDRGVRALRFSTGRDTTPEKVQAAAAAIAAAVGSK